MVNQPPLVVEPSDVPAEQVGPPAALDLHFEGFTEAAFEILDRLKEHPHIEQYREEKDGIRRYLKEPFKRYRDDLVVNWVLPKRLGFETEKNVFSRLLKNDFGAGGCHHHLWMSFYRHGLRRLGDVQLAHSLSPRGLDVGLYVGDNAPRWLKQAKARIIGEPEVFAGHVNDLLSREGWRFVYSVGRGANEARVVHTGPLDAVPDDLRRARGIWVRRLIARADVLNLGGRVVKDAIEALAALWPLYRFYLTESIHD